MGTSNKPVKGYKVTNPDSTCRNFLFEVGKTYSHDGKIALCEEGFHFYIKGTYCFSYYSFDSKNLVYEVEAVGETIHGEDKSVTNSIAIIRLLTWAEVLEIANMGKDNTGHSNTGNWNTGNSNTGDSNTGNWNTGNSNTGYSNTGNWNTGAFCTGEPTIKLFDKDSGITYSEFERSNVYSLLCDVNTKFWVQSEAMTEAEKTAHPSWETVGGYLKDIPYKEAFANKWGNWSKENRQAFIDLPNFDKTIFEKITSVKVD